MYGAGSSSAPWTSSIIFPLLPSSLSRFAHSPASFVSSRVVLSRVVLMASPPKLRAPRACRLVCRSFHNTSQVFEIFPALSGGEWPDCLTSPTQQH